MIHQRNPASRPAELERLLPSAGQASIDTSGEAVRMARLAAELSHDLRVPMCTIIASLEMLEEQLGERPNPDAVALLDRITKAAGRMLRMLDAHMIVDPVAVGRSCSAVDLDEVAHQLACDCRPLLEMAGASLEVGRLPVVRARPDEMYSVLQNLLTNAVKFTRPGVLPQVSISARQIPWGWHVSVMDNGIGIPAERRMEVFTLFSRVDSGVEGHGIGLGTVARMVHDLDGRVGADEAPGGGAEVWFELPADAAYTADARLASGSLSDAFRSPISEGSGDLVQPV